MAYNTKEVLRDVSGNPISQYYDPITDSYNPVEGSSGGNKVTVENNDLSLIPILDKLSQLTGTVIDEESRKSNEVQRVVDEDIRKSNETTRVNSESTRVNSENTRKTQESGRVSAESSRVTVESGRVTAESARVSNEDTRKSNEITRESSEATRISNEDTRKSNEISRQSSETIRNTNEDARIDSEDSRESSESTRIGNELAREVDEGIRKSQELGRASAESDRVSAETSRESAESTRESQESTRQSQESSRQSKEVIRESQESNRESNEDLRIALYDDLQSKLASGFFKGEKGNTGNGLEYTWNGTQLGVRVEGTTEYVYVDLKGEKGDTGEIENLTGGMITDALGYIPLSEDSLPSNLETTTGSQAKANVALASANQYTDQKVGNVADVLLALEHSELSSIATDVDDEGIYRSVEYRRKDNTLYAKSTLIGSYPYSQIKIDYYNGTGNEIIKPISWNIGYDENDFPYIREVI